MLEEKQEAEKEPSEASSFAAQEESKEEEPLCECVVDIIKTVDIPSIEKRSFEGELFFGDRVFFIPHIKFVNKNCPEESEIIKRCKWELEPKEGHNLSIEKGCDVFLRCNYTLCANLF